MELVFSFSLSLYRSLCGCVWCPPAGHLDVVRLLVNQGAEVSCKDKRGYTPLHTAASSGQIAVIKHLLNLAVEVNTRTHAHTQRQTGRNSVVMLSRWPQIDESNAFGNTALHLACFNGQDMVASELIDCGANVSQPNNKGFTPLHFAAASTHGALCLEFLVNNGADVNVQVWQTCGQPCHRHRTTANINGPFSDACVKTIRVQFPGPAPCVPVTCFHEFIWCVYSSFFFKKRTFLHIYVF